MRKYIMPIVAVIALASATPIMAYDTGGLLSMQQALDVATDIGLTTVSHTQFAGDKWEIQGRDRTGRYIESLSTPAPVTCFGSTGSRKSMIRT
jgi:hypothetical protein